MLVFLPENLEAGFKRQVAVSPELQFGLFAECQLTSHDLIQRRDLAAIRRLMLFRA